PARAFWVSLRASRISERIKSSWSQAREASSRERSDSSRMSRAARSAVAARALVAASKVIHASAIGYPFPRMSLAVLRCGEPHPTEIRQSKRLLLKEVPADFAHAGRALVDKLPVRLIGVRTGWRRSRQIDG